MNEVSTTFQVLDQLCRGDDFNGTAGLRLYRAGSDLMVRGGFVGGCVGDPDIGSVRLSADDARALRDWLNEEFPDDCECEVGGIDMDPHPGWGNAQAQKIAEEQGYILTPWGYVRA